MSDATDGGRPSAQDYTFGEDPGRGGNPLRPASPPEEFDFPVVYEGTDEECSFCQRPPHDGDRVVRLTCRLVFHEECWNRWCSARPNRACPNCRGAGVCIAVWNYVGPSSSTQAIDGVTTPNELEQYAPIHNTSTPEVPTPPTPRSADSEDRSWMRVAASSTALYCRSHPTQTKLADERP